MLTKEELKKRLLLHIERLKKLTDEQMEKMTEDDTRSQFIDKLLIDVLGWNDDVDILKRGRAVEKKGVPDHSDYEYPKIPKIIVEAKRLGLDREVENGEFDAQVKEYAYRKPVDWAVLTDFRRFKVWYMGGGTGFTGQTFCDIDFLNEDNLDNAIDRLQWFQDDNLLGGGIEKELEVLGWHPKETDIAEDFSYSLNFWREKLNNYFSDTPQAEKEKLIQGLFNRLIFIKKLEAEQIEPRELENIYREDYEDYYARIVKIFKRYRKKYDTDIFGKPEDTPELESITIRHEIIRDVLNAISKPPKSKKGYNYNFSAIDVDVIGTIYENYLAFVQNRAEKNNSGKAEKRKHGIYYTPKNIVDYLVRQTLMDRLNSSSLSETKRLKIIDPACGSGSFLINVIGRLNEYYQQRIEGYKDFSVNRKLDEIKNNIYGVDLDKKAVDIAKLSIYLKMLASLKNKISEASAITSLLPQLSDNIKDGNSLVEDKSIEADAFEWRKEFKDIMKDGGFDIIIGNPPWSSKIKTDVTKKIAEEMGLGSNNINICALFVFGALDKLNADGTLGFLLPKQFIKNDAYFKVRKKILDECQITHLIDFGQFPHVASDAIGLVVNKTKGKSEVRRHLLKEGKFVETKVAQTVMQRSPIKAFSFTITEEIQDTLDRIAKDTTPLGGKGGMFKIKRGIELGQDSNVVRCRKCGNYNEADTKYYSQSQEEKICRVCGSKLVITGEDNLDTKGMEGKISSAGRSSFYSEPCFSGDRIQLYHTENPYYIPKELKGIDYKEEAFKGNKILLKRIASAIEGTFVEKDLKAFNTVYSLYNLDRRREDFMYALGVLNSKLMHFYYEQTYNLGMSLTTQVTIKELSEIPIKIPKNDDKEALVKLVEKALVYAEETYNRRDEVISLTNWNRKRGSGLTEITNEIDKLVYKVYGITEEEKKVIEENLK